MFNWIKKLFGVKPKEIPWGHNSGHYPVGTVSFHQFESYIFKRVVRIMTEEDKLRGWGTLYGGKDLRYWQYFCPECGGELTPGPSGAGTNQVCEKCHINYGCLPDALER